MERLIDRAKEVIRESIRLKEMLLSGSLEPVVAAAELIAEALKRGNKVVIFGNGGSAADAQHIAAEFVNRLSGERPPLGAIALTTDTSVLTSVGNDRSFSEVFSRQVRALGSRGDIAWGLTTSGRSENVLLALREARTMGMATVAMTGRSRLGAGELADIWIPVEHDKAHRIQEVHILLGHIICEMVEESLFPGGRADQHKEE
jgi:D-sedoheptulose 7-phosphate isomerase